MKNPQKQSEKDAKSSAAAKKEILSSFSWERAEDSTIDKLSEADLAHCVLVATVRGREILVRDLIERRGHVPIVITRHDDGDHDFRLNGQSVDTNFRHFTNDIKSRESLKSLFTMIAEFGMKGLIEPGASFPLLWHRLDDNQLIHKLPPARFEGELPSLVSGVLGHPELAVVLHEESSESATPAAYSQILCWASEHMIRQFPQGLSPLRSVQSVEKQGSFKEWKARSGTPQSDQYGAIKVGVGRSACSSDWANFTFRDMGPASARLGLEDRQGRVLCETTTGFLLSFPTSSYSEANLRVANVFVKKYCPIEVMALQAAEACTRDFGHEKTTYQFQNHLTTRMSDKFDLLFTSLSSDDRVKDLMTHEQWRLLLKHADFISAASLLALHQVLGIDNSGSSVTLDADDLLLLIEGGYRFADGTKVFTKDLDIHDHNRTQDLNAAPSVRLPDRLHFPDTSNTDSGIQSHSEDLAQMLSIFRGIDRMNLWPTQDIRPVDLGHALKMSSRLDMDHIGSYKAMAVHSKILNAGVEACAGVASSPAQWMKLTEVFTPDELKPYLKVMPSKAKGRLLELGLGL